jgi:nucleoside 2-deoxyribosyltransferase
MKIKFEENNGFCLIECPHKIKTKTGTILRVGSSSCKNCEYNKGIDIKENIVFCSLGEFKTIYLASALFTKAEQDYNIKLYEELVCNGFEVFLPQKQCNGLNSSKEISEKCKQGIKQSDFLIVNMEGTDVDSGTAWECGFATALNIPIIGLRTDFRQRGDDGGLNCMLSQNTVNIITKNNIDEIIEEILEVV